MKYEKPEIVALPAAIEAIQSVKAGGSLDSICGDPHDPGRTACGYESDE